MLEADCSVSVWGVFPIRRFTNLGLDSADGLGLHCEIILPGSVGVTAFFALTLLMNASLMFGVEPMIAKMLLPLLGGAAAVWTTCMVFYQVALLAGYLYAHVATTRFPAWLQVTVQAALLAVAFWMLPFKIGEPARDALTNGAAPLPWLLLELFAMAGLPFFVVATTAPLLQHWFSNLGHRSSGDPYFLFSASNVGSLLALAAYPAWMETAFDIREQARLWRMGFLVLAVLVVIAGAKFLASSRPMLVKSNTAEPAVSDLAAGETRITWKRRVWWVLLAFVPASLMLGTTTYLTTDIASVPLLWIIPLGIYLLTFVIAFSRRAWVPLAWVNWLLPVLGIMLVFLLLSRATEPVVVLILCHLLFLFCAGLVCHSRLAADRPDVRRLTEFYLWLAGGGALGGMFNAILAPLVFRDVVEYPLMILVACALYVPRRLSNTRYGKIGSWWPVPGLGAFALLLGFMVKGMGWNPGTAVRVLVFGLPTVLCFGLVTRPAQFAGALLCVMLGGHVYVEMTRRTILVDRSFFGVLRVTVSANGLFRQLEHGDTAHGRQFIDESRACEPLAYYHWNGPLGTIFRAYNESDLKPCIGLIGMGAATTLAYSLPGQAWDVYEIDPLVIRIASNPRMFTYLTKCSAVVPKIIEGDGRLQIARATDGRYGMLILDAFSSDAVPMHLLTEEAVELYFSKIAPGGWLVMHVSNRYLDLEQVIAGLAQKRGYAGLSWIDAASDAAEGKDESHWIVLARKESDIRELNNDPNRIPLASRPAADPWTDERSSLLPIFKW